MAKKAFEIQGSNLTLGGVNLQAGRDGVVIPGVTQAVNYTVDEIDEFGSDDNQDLGSDDNAVTVIDNSRYMALTGTAPSELYIPAEYSVNELDDGNIEEINVETAGLFADGDKTRAQAGNMWATLTPDPFVDFNSDNWIQIPFRPKFRANTVENIGGGGSSEQIIYDEDVTNRVEVNADGARIRLNTQLDEEDQTVWQFSTNGSLTFPDGTIQETAYTGSGDNSYTPEDPDHWNDPAVNTVQAALDELAAKIAALQNYEIDGGNAFTPPQGELLIDGNNGA